MKHQKLLTTPEISKRMASVHLKGSKEEKALAKELWKRGFRYRKNYRKLPGSPDVVILNITLLYLWMGSFGMEKIGKKRKIV